MKKLLVFAHVPPPAHGQSLLVLWMLEELKAAGEIEVIHVDCRISSGLDDVGSVRTGKLGLLLGYCWQAIRARFRTGVKAFYYVPAPGKRAALYRDWIVMALCRPFFPKMIFHWHAMGLGEWLEREATGLERGITRLLMGRPELSLVPAEVNRAGVEWFRSKKTEVLYNGVLGICSGREVDALLEERRQRLEERRQILAGEREAGAVYRLLFMSLCTREKGLFDALEGVAIYNEGNPKIPARLTVAGGFAEEAERQEFDAMIRDRGMEDVVEYVGFVSGAEKARVLKEADAFCFPTYYKAESFGLVLVEAMSVGCLPLVTRWRAIPEILPEGYPGFVEPRSPAQVAEMIGKLMTLDLAGEMCAEFERRFTLKRFMASFNEAVREICRL